MKLLEKTARTYLFISGTAFLIAGAIIYFVLSYLLNEQLNEKLISDIENVKSTIARDGILPDYYPFIQTKEVALQTENSYEKKDTLIFDADEDGNIDFRQISLVCSVNGKNYFIAARNELFENSDLLGTIVSVIGSVFILLLLCLYFINKKLSANIWQPFYNTLDNLKGFSHNDPDFELPDITEIDEFVELNNTLKNLTQKVISDYQLLKRFTEDASHEIQTPLAVIQSKLETLLQYPDLKKDEVELINSSYASTLRLSKLTQTLLLLTKIANDQFPEKKAVNLSELLEEKIKLFDDHIFGKSLTIKKEIAPNCILETNYFLAESLVMNLIGNAAKYCTSGGIIRISINTTHFEISNTGTPFSVPPSKLFERFFKINRSSASHGLGLSIVKEICSHNKWTIIYKYEEDLHIFIVNF
jgi:signal transduction histidine kinase